MSILRAALGRASASITAVGPADGVLQTAFVLKLKLAGVGNQQPQAAAGRDERPAAVSWLGMAP